MMAFPDFGDVRDQWWNDNHARLDQFQALAAQIQAQRTFVP